MSSPLMRAGWAGLLALFLATPVLAGPGPGGPGGPGFGGPGFRHFEPGPRHGHGLPGAAREVWIGSTLYFLAAGTYYLWNASQQQYVVVSPPPVAETVTLGAYEVIAYPSRGQTAEQQARDRYECHRWAVGQSGFDPASAQAAPPVGVSELYRRALGACLSGRGYSIN